MRTTLDIDDDVLQPRKSSPLAGGRTQPSRAARVRNGVPVLLDVNLLVALFDPDAPELVRARFVPDRCPR